MRAVLFFVYLILILFRGYARTDVTIQDKPVCTAHALKQAQSHHALASFAGFEAEEDDDDDFAKKFKPSLAPATLHHTIVVNHLYKSFYNRLPVVRPVPYRYLLLSSLRI